MDLSHATLSFFGTLGGGGDKGGLDGDGGEGGGEPPYEILTMEGSGALPPIPTPIEPSVCSLPEHCVNLSVPDRSPAFPAPLQFREPFSRLPPSHQPQPQTPLHQQITVETQLPSQTQTQPTPEGISQYSPLAVTSPLSCNSLSPLPQGLTQTAIHSPPGEPISFETFSSQTQVRLFSMLEQKQSIAQWISLMFI